MAVVCLAMGVFAAPALASPSGGVVFSPPFLASSDPSSDTTSLEATGVSVSPSRLRMNGQPGETITETIKITNNTDQPNSFKMGFYDFDMNGLGKSSFIEPGEGKYSLSRWASISPTFVVVEPGERKEVTVTISLPNDDAGRKAAWSVLMVEQASERRTLDIPAPGEESVAFGVIPTFAFGVFLYQNPPNVVSSQVDITQFDISALPDATGQIDFEVENTGDGIAYCTAYIELTNLSTGSQQKLHVKHFTILPDLIRDFEFRLPDKMEPGRYSAVGVLDFGSEEEIQAAELEFEVAR